MTTPLPATDRDTLDGLLAREAIVDAIVTLFIATDARDWATVREVLAPDVVFDMTSLVGGEAETRSAEAIAAGWEEGLRPLEQVHHQAGNFRVQLDGGRATASCYGIAYHYRRHPSGRSTRVFVGTYDFGLERDTDGRWRITSFRFVVRFVDGNLTLERDD